MFELQTNKDTALESKYKFRLRIEKSKNNNVSKLKKVKHFKAIQ